MNPDIEPTPEALSNLYREDAVGLLRDDRSRLAWQYSTIFEREGVTAIENLAAHSPERRALLRRDMWQEILKKQRLERRPRREILGE